MKYYPICLNIQNKRCLVVGGGGVGERKAAMLMTCGAEVSVVSPEFTKRLAELSQNGDITLIKRPYESSDVSGVFLVIGATDNESLNRQIHADAMKLNILCNIADRPELCNFILPSVVGRDDLIIAVSTSGKSPALAKKIRIELEKQYGGEYSLLLKLMGAVRKRLLSQAHEPETHKSLFEQMLASPLTDLIRAGNVHDIDAVLHDILGEEFQYGDLMKDNAN